jgi:hypothetical protein
VSLTVREFGAALAQFQEDLKSLGSEAPLVMARAVNRAGISGKTAMVKAVAADLGLTQKYVSADIRIGKASKAAPTFAVEVQGRRIPLIAFGARGPEPSKGKGGGVTYRLPSGAGRVPNAFIATVGSGQHRGVFKRIGVSRRRSVGAWSPNLPIVELRGPSLPTVFEKHVDAFFVAAEESLVKNLEHEIDFARSKRAGGEGA